MPRFRYKAVTGTGETVEGELDAASQKAVVDRLRADANIPIKVEQLRESVSGGIRLLSWRSRRVTGKDVVILTRELATLLRAKLPLDRALSILSDLSDAGPVKSLVDELLEAIRGGTTLTDALRAHENLFPGFYIGMVRAGEAGGSLETVLTRLAESLERRQALQESVRSALNYPILVLLMVGGSLVVLFTFVIPEFRPLFEDSTAEIPFSTKVVFAISDGFQAYGLVLAILLLLALIGVRRHNSRPEGRRRWDGWVLQTPLFGDLITKIEVARFSRTLGMLLTNGVSMLNALTIAVESTGNRAFGQRLQGLASRLGKGDSLAGSLSDLALFPRLAVQLLQAGEESGELEEMLEHIAQVYDVEVQRAVERMLSLLVPVVTIGLGLLVAGVIGSMLGAILSTYQLPF